MLNFDDYSISDRAYGGLACRKLGLQKDGEYYLLKFPNKVKGMRNINISYANDVYSEYIASKVISHYLPTHEVQLGVRDGKVCALCKDFCGNTGRLYQYSELKTTMSREVLRPNGDISDGNDPDIEAVEITLHENSLFRQVHDVETRFWTMFIVDAVNGNPDRNNGNWGVLVDNGHVTFAPIYDNGNSLNSKYSDDQLAECLADSSRFKALAYSGFRCFFTEDEMKINPFHYLESGVNTRAVEVLRDMDLDFDVSSIINSLEISDVRKEFYEKMYKIRYTELRRIRDMLEEVLSPEEKARWDALPPSLRDNYTGSKRELLRHLDWRS